MAPPDHLRRGEGVKCCSETQVLQPARQTRATFPSQNKTIFAVGSVATKALHRVSLSPPASPTGHRRRGWNSDRRGAPATRTQDGSDAGGRWSSSSLPEPSFCASITPCCLIGGDLASCEREGGAMPNPCPSLLAAASFCHQGIAAPALEGCWNKMQPQSARWACSHHMAAMTKAAKALQVLREPLLNEFSREMRPCIQITSPSASAFIQTAQQNGAQMGL